MKRSKIMLLPTLIALFLVDSTIAGGFLGCPSGCSCNDTTLVVNCEETKLDVIPITLNPAIQRLVLRNNKLKTVDAAFQFYRDLQYVDLSSNQLVSIPTKMFLNQDKLQELHLEKNRLSTIMNKTFEGLRSLTVLNLRQNFLEELTKGIFSVLPKLEELNLGQNRLSKIDPFAFEGLLNLRVLYLDDNMLSSIPTVSFSVVPSLAELHIGLNAFYSLPNDSFKGLSRLTVLDLESAGLSGLSDHTFRGLSGLRNLNLEDNRLQNIPTISLGQLKRLEELSIGRNEFKVLQRGSFKNIKNLKKLDITGARYLERVEKGAFEENMNLETITIVNNQKLKSVDEGALMGLPNLKHLVLRDNVITSLSESVASWHEMDEVDLMGNLLNCDCQVLWLVILAKQKNLSSVQCITPQKLHDMSLMALTVDDLGCSISDRNRNIVIVTFCISAMILLTVLGLFLFRYRLKVRVAIRDYKFSKTVEKQMEHEYEKTFFDDESTLRRHHLPIKHISVEECNNVYSNPDSDEWPSLDSASTGAAVPTKDFIYFHANETYRSNTLKTLQVKPSNSLRSACPQCPVHSCQSKEFYIR